MSFFWTPTLVWVFAQARVRAPNPVGFRPFGTTEGRGALAYKRETRPGLPTWQKSDKFEDFIPSIAYVKKTE